MRFYLIANGMEAEVSVSQVQAEKGGLGHVATALHSPAHGADQRHYVLSSDAAHELCQDGSYRRHTLLRGRYDPSKWTFFHSGRVRAVCPVGGIGGRVESLQSEGTVKAPMNGRVVKISKTAGESVESGDIVLLLEAMKMENEVTAPISGVLKELKVEPGQTVAPGQLLFCVEAAE